MPSSRIRGVTAEFKAEILIEIQGNISTSASFMLMLLAAWHMYVATPDQHPAVSVGQI